MSEPSADPRPGGTPGVADVERLRIDYAESLSQFFTMQQAETTRRANIEAELRAEVARLTGELARERQQLEAAWHALAVIRSRAPVHEEGTT